MGLPPASPASSRPNKCGDAYRRRCATARETQDAGARRRPPRERARRPAARRTSLAVVATGRYLRPPLHRPEMLAVARPPAVALISFLLTSRPQLQQEHVLPEAAAWLADGVDPERLLRVRCKQDPAAVLRHVGPRRVPEVDAAGVGVVVHVAPMMRERHTVAPWPCGTLVWIPTISSSQARHGAGVLL